MSLSTNESNPVHGATRTPGPLALRQALLADLGELGLEGGDLGPLVQHALGAICTALDVSHAAVFERAPQADLLLMRAGVGWRDGTVGRFLLTHPAGCPLWATLRSGRVVLADDRLRSAWADGSPFLADHGLTTAAVVPMPGAPDTAAVLGAFSGTKGPFGPDDVDYLRCVAHILGGAVARKGTEEGLLQSQARLQSVQKMEAIGRLAGGIAHDFNNLVQAILGFTEMMLRALPERDPLLHNALEIKKAGERAASLTGQLLAFSRQQLLQPEVLAVNHVVTNVEQLLRRLIGEDVELETVLAPDLGAVKADAAQLEQVLMNLAVNARDAMPDGGTLTIETRNVQLTRADQREGDAFVITPGAYVLLAVSDTGCGMDAETLRRAFDPFFTTKPVGQGTGLGLSTVYGIVKQSGGYIWLDSDPGAGTRCRIYLPRVAEAVRVPEARRRSPAVAPRGTETLLIVEDEQGVREVMTEWLDGHGYRVLSATNGIEALAVARGYDGGIDVLIADVMMPQMGGPQLAAHLLAERPDVKVIYVSGYADEAIGDPQVLSAGAGFLQKPFTLDSLVRKVRDILGDPAA